MLTDEAIGKWALRSKPYGPSTYRRDRPPRPISAAHLVDSIVADSIVTACGRRMQYKTVAGKLQVAAPEAGACMPCQGIRDARESRSATT